ncbi:hypothetical protein ACLB2K_068492 [Fragaria x ananassa]|uniref:dnaJ homolog subfamily C member 7 homolog n=1 Tax=Fragaria vesca subsp. vesca TaxID=101020 RepID=UPI0005C9731E|nr:PREDICTED: dnaJ homolog subfamily C member 7 homolog [Fragaria vesca subsp. vesca]
MAAIKALDDAEAYFKLQKLDAAIKQATQARNLNPNLPNVDNFITAYKIHKAMSSKKNWYVVLGIPECTPSLIVNKRYKELALVVHPDKNVSASAEGAFKHVKAALDFLSDPVRKKDYDKSLMSKKKAYAAAASRKAAAAAAAKEVQAAAARSEINSRKRRSNQPMSELEYGINLIMKYSPKYMERKFSV